MSHSFFFCVAYQASRGRVCLLPHKPVPTQILRCSDDCGSTPTWTTLLIIRANGHRLQRGLDQAQRNAKVVEPGLDFLFMIAPFEGSAGRREFFRLFLQIVALTPTHCMNETTTNYYQIHANTTDRSGDRPAILQEPCLAFALQFDPCVEISAEHTLSPHQPGGRSGKRLR